MNPTAALNKERVKARSWPALAALTGLVCLSAAWSQAANGSGPTEAADHAAAPASEQASNLDDPAVQAGFAADIALKTGMRPADRQMVLIDKADAAGHAEWMSDALRRYLATWRAERTVRQRIVHEPWQHGPATVQLAPGIRLSLPAGYKYLGPEGVADLRRQAGTRTMAELQPRDTGIGDLDRTLHPTDPSAGDLAIAEHLLMPDDEHWAAQLLTARTGHVAVVPMDSDRLLQTLRIRLNPYTMPSLNQSEPTAYDGERVRWIHVPDYDPATHSLAWAHTDGSISLKTDAPPGEKARGYVAVLGRTQTVSAALAPGNPKAISAALDQLRPLMTAISFAPGQGYQDYRDGDLKANIDATGFITGPETLAEAGARRLVQEQTRHRIPAVGDAGPAQSESILHYLWTHLQYVALLLLLLAWLLPTPRKQDDGDKKA
jgi:uncharacterized membrane-anchored protein